MACGKTQNFTQIPKQFMKHTCSPLHRTCSVCDLQTLFYLGNNYLNISRKVMVLMLEMMLKLLYCCLFMAGVGSAIKLTLRVDTGNVRKKSVEKKNKNK